MDTLLRGRSVTREVDVNMGDLPLRDYLSRSSDCVYEEPDAGEGEESSTIFCELLWTWGFVFQLSGAPSLA